jgi:hypothetical protein
MPPTITIRCRAGSNASVAPQRGAGVVVAGVIRSQSVPSHSQVSAKSSLSSLLPPNRTLLPRTGS